MTPDERAATVAADKRDIARFLELAPQMTREQLGAATWTLVAFIVGRAVAQERERCARVAEGCSESDTAGAIAAAIRATGTTAAYRDALAPAAAHFGGAPVPTGALACGSRVLRDVATGTTAADLGGES